MNLHNGEIIAFETTSRPMFTLIKSMLDKALERLDKDDRHILHSDKGWPYEMPAWNRMLGGRRIAQSMPGRVIASTMPPWKASSQPSNLKAARLFLLRKVLPLR
jgi:hypothetical protein